MESPDSAMICSGVKHEPSERPTNDKPALECRAVRTHPCTVTMEPTEVFPEKQSATRTADTTDTAGLGERERG
ncbi:hypothetical protein LBMAG42_12170 [Deltaproteobacteria bacterium]|nr:hypothetical protein LBMAG42_12170 [Deltaproteobacteria bacterium]